MTTMAFSFTACSDDDDKTPEEKPEETTDENTVTINGNKYAVDAVDVVYVEAQDGYEITFFQEDGEDYTEIATIDIDESHLGKVYSLTQDLSGEAWYTGLSFPGFNEWGYWTDEEAFQSGTIFVNITDEALSVKISGKAKASVDEDGNKFPAFDFAFKYEGEYDYYIGELEDEDGEAEMVEEAATRSFFSAPAKKNHHFLRLRK